MKLTLKNIGKIGTASVEINGITVIAGEKQHRQEYCWPRSFLLCLTGFVMFKSKLKTSESIV